MSNVAKLRPAPAPPELHHLAFAEAFARAHADDRRHWATRGRWMAWSAGEGWREATEPLHDMTRAIDRIVPTDERAAWYRVNHLRDGLTMAAESLSRHEWDQGDAVLGLPAGRVVELTTGVDRAQTPDDWITMAAGCDLADEISIPWLDFVGEACGGDGEMASALQAAVGAAAFGHNREHRVEVLCGDGGTGKSTFAETISAALGGYAGVLPASVLNARNEQHPTGIAGLLGKRFVTAPEVTGGTFRSETLKAISGGDAIPARFMRRDFFTFRPAATVWICRTNRPRYGSSTMRSADGCEYGRSRRGQPIPTRRCRPGCARRTNCRGCCGGSSRARTNTRPSACTTAKQSATRPRPTSRRPIPWAVGSRSGVRSRKHRRRRRQSSTATTALGARMRACERRRGQHGARR